MQKVKASCCKRVWNCIQQLVTFGVWGSSSLILVALLLGAIFGSFGRDSAKRLPSDPWIQVEDRLWGPLLGEVGFDRAIKLIETKVPTKQKEPALHELLSPSSVPVRPSAVSQMPILSLTARNDEGLPVTDFAEKQEAYQKKFEETERQENTKRLVELKTIHRVLDKLQTSTEVLNDYAILAKAYATVGARAESNEAYRQLDEKIEGIGGIAEQLRDWFIPLFRDHIALVACSIMAIVVFFLKPTVNVQAKAFSLWFHSRNANRYIQEALGNKLPAEEKVVLP